MNKKRRTKLNGAIKSLRDLKSVTDKAAAADVIRKASSIVSDMGFEEQECVDNLPESLQWSMMSDAMNDNIADLEDASDDLASIASDIADDEEFAYEAYEEELEEAIDKIESAIFR